jgi:hypothetical protein
MHMPTALRIQDEKTLLKPKGLIGTGSKTLTCMCNRADAAAEMILSLFSTGGRLHSSSSNLRLTH